MERIATCTYTLHNYDVISVHRRLKPEFENLEIKKLQYCQYKSLIKFLPRIPRIANYELTIIRLFKYYKWE